MTCETELQMLREEAEMLAKYHPSKDARAFAASVTKALPSHETDTVWVNGKSYAVDAEVADTLWPALSNKTKRLHRPLTVL